MKRSQVPLTPARHYLIPEETSCTKFVAARAGGRGRRGARGLGAGGIPVSPHLPASPSCFPPSSSVGAQLKRINDLKQKLCLMKPRSDSCANANPVCRQIFTNPLCIKGRATCSPPSLCLPGCKGSTVWFNLRRPSRLNSL